MSKMKYGDMPIGQIFVTTPHYTDPKPLCMKCFPHGPHAMAVAIRGPHIGDSFGFEDDAVFETVEAYFVTKSETTMWVAPENEAAYKRAGLEPSIQFPHGDERGLI